MTDTKIDFTAIHAAAVSARVWEQWYPTGRRIGAEWCVGDVQGNPGASLKINTRTGKWKDWASAEPGGDLIQLNAARLGKSPGEAARDLAQTLGMQAGDTPNPQPAAKPPEQYFLISPIPDTAPPAVLNPPPYLTDNLTRTAAYHYRDQHGALYQIVTRWEPPAGSGLKKQILPFTLWRDRKTNRMKWRCKAHPSPPLYGAHLITDDTTDVIVVEGEKAADALRPYVKIPVITWAGGTNRIEQSDWSPLRRVSTVRIWPDADEPGHRAARTIRSLLPASVTVLTRFLVPAD